MIRILSKGRASLLFAAAAICSSSASAQKVLLQIKPHVGDTIRMHLTQTVEMSGRSASSGAAMPPVSTSTEVFSRAIPYQWTRDGTLIHAITDSVTPGLAGSAAPIAGTRRSSMAPKPAVIRISLDGAMEVVDDGDANSEVRHIFAEMPSMLPRNEVSVGETWIKEMRIPLAAEPGASGTVKAAMHLDSLSRNSEVAYISIRGTLSRLPRAGDRAAGDSRSPAGTFAGSMQINRALGWITDARSVISVKSRIPSASRSTPPAKPMDVQTRVTVWARAMVVGAR